MHALASPSRNPATHMTNAEHAVRVTAYMQYTHACTVPTYKVYSLMCSQICSCPFPPLRVVRLSASEYSRTVQTVPVVHSRGKAHARVGRVPFEVICSRRSHGRDLTPTKPFSQSLTLERSRVCLVCSSVRAIGGLELDVSPHLPPFPFFPLVDSRNRYPGWGCWGIE